MSTRIGENSLNLSTPFILPARIRESKEVEGHLTWEISPMPPLISARVKQRPGVYSGPSDLPKSRDQHPTRRDMHREAQRLSTVPGQATGHQLSWDKALAVPGQDTELRLSRSKTSTALERGTCRRASSHHVISEAVTTQIIFLFRTTNSPTWLN